LKEQAFPTRPCRRSPLVGLPAPLWKQRMRRCPARSQAARGGVIPTASPPRHGAHLGPTTCPAPAAPDVALNPHPTHQCRHLALWVRYPAGFAYGGDCCSRITRPVIVTSLSTSKGSTFGGLLLTVTGSGFSHVAARNRVTLNNRRASVISAGPPYTMILPSCCRSLTPRFGPVALSSSAAMCC